MGVVTLLVLVSGIEGRGLFSVYPLRAGTLIGPQYYVFSNGTIRFVPEECNFAPLERDGMSDDELLYCFGRAVNHGSDAPFSVVYDSGGYVYLRADVDLPGFSEVVYDYDCGPCGVYRDGAYVRSCCRDAGPVLV